MTKPATVGVVNAELQLQIGDYDPIPLSSLDLPITVRNGGVWHTYELGIDVKEVAEIVKGIFKTSGKDQT